MFVNYIVSRMDFTEATDRLMESVTLADLARELGASYGLVRQARMHPSSGSYRRPPNGWESAVAKLASQRAAELKSLQDELERISDR